MVSIAVFYGADARADCASYCSTIATNCSGTNQQYDGPDPASLCAATCSHWMAGMTGDQQGNSVACREYHAQQASNDPAQHCPHAGPAGANACGVQCANFCGLIQSICTGNNLVYDDPIACDEGCLANPDANNPYTADATDVTDSFRCRMYHLTAASTDPATHCGHAAAQFSVVGDSPICVEPLVMGTGGAGGTGVGGESSAGSGGMGAGGDGGSATTGSAGPGPSSGAGTAPGGGLDRDSGCSVSEPSSSSSGGGWLALILGALFVRRRD
jgi:MYXO-CTERM domain-containing protein